MAPVKPFQPKGERAQWRIIHEMLERLDVGDTLTYEQIKDALDVDDINRVRGAVRQAAKVWGEERHRAIAPVYRVGYRVVGAAEHELLARSQHRRSRRALNRGRAFLRDADRSQLSPADRARFDRMEFDLSRQADMIKRIDTRQDNMQRALEEDRLARKATEEKLARMEEAMRRHGIEPD